MNRDILINNLGLTDKEAAVYLSILELGSSTVQPIATQSGVKRTSIYYFIDHLIELGLIEKVQIRNRWHFKALSPNKMVELQEKRLDQIKMTLPQFESIFNVSTSKPKISYFEGPEQIKNILLEETRCKEEVLGIWSGKEVSELFSDQKLLKEVDQIRRQKGIKVKVVRIREKDEPFEEFGDQPGSNRELRYAPEGTNFPMAISIFDTGKVGFMTSKKEGFGILIESEEVVSAMKILFYSFWEQAKPINN